MGNGSPVGGRAWDGNNPFVQPASTTIYWGSGDVDGDGVVTSADAGLAQQMVDNTLAPLPAADVDGNGMVDAADVTMINDAVAGATLPGWWNKLSTRAQRNAWVDKVMALEPTKDYADPVWWFVCVQFSLQTQIHQAFYRNDLFGTYFSGGSTWFNIPLYSVSLSYGHAINGILVATTLSILTIEVYRTLGRPTTFRSTGQNAVRVDAWIFLVPDQIEVGPTVIRRPCGRILRDGRQMASPSTRPTAEPGADAVRAASGDGADDVLYLSGTHGLFPEGMDASVRDSSASRA